MFEKFKINVSVYRNGRRNIPDVDYFAYIDVREEDVEKVRDVLGNHIISGFNRVTSIDFSIGRYDVLPLGELSSLNETLTLLGYGVATWKTGTEIQKETYNDTI